MKMWLLGESSVFACSMQIKATQRQKVTCKALKGLFGLQVGLKHPRTWCHPGSELFDIQSQGQVACRLAQAGIHCQH